MKIARNIGLAAVAAMALMASAGVGTASAAPTTLCKTNTESPFCSSTDRYPAETALKASASKVTIDAAGFTITCESTLEGKTSAATGEPLPLSVSAWTLSGCKYGELGLSCSTATTEHLPYAGSLTRTTGSNGTLTLSSGGSGQPGWHLTCGDVVDCIYTFDPDFTFNGGNPAQMTVAEESLIPTKKAPYVLCPTATIMPSTYTVNSPQPAYVAAWKEPIPPGYTVLCSTKLCDDQGNVYRKDTVIETEPGTLSVYTSSGTHDWACKAASFKAKTTADYGNPLPISISSWPMSECELTSFKSPCEVKTVGWESSSLSRDIWGEVGDGVWEGVGVSWRLTCGPPTNISCTYKIPSWWVLHLHGGSPAVVGIDAPLHMSGDFCPSKAQMQGELTVASPKPLFVTDVG